MKKAFTAIIVFLFLFAITDKVCVAQSGWELVYEDVAEEGMIKGIDFVPGEDNLWQNGWAVQYNGTIAKTTDGGTTWVEIMQNLSEGIWGLDFVDQNIGFTCDIWGKIMKTTDGGVSWSIVYEDLDRSFNKIMFKDQNSGVVVGFDSNMYTDDGGLTWSASAGENENYWGLDYAEGDTYYTVAAFDAPLARSTDNGQNWSGLYPTPFDLLICVDFLDGEHGIIGGSASQIEITTDGGESWTPNTIADSEGTSVLAARWFDEDTLWACGTGVFKSTDAGDTWVQDTSMADDNITNREMFISKTNVIYVSGFNLGQNLSQIWRKIGVLPVIPEFITTDTLICTGTSVDFIDQSLFDIITWEWTFEGGNPSSSTEQNTSVIYEDTGIFDVTLTVTNSQGNAGTIIVEDYIAVLEIPGQAQKPNGEVGICTSNPYVYTIPTVEFAQDYIWEVVPADAGELTWVQNEAYLETSDSWTGDFTMKARATNICGNGEWSDELTITLSSSPEVYTLQGGGAYCEGGEGVEITLDGSQTGVDYELYFEGTATGQIVPGTGGAISFGNLMEAGVYEGLGFNDNCEAYMSEQIEVIVNALPIPEVSGHDMVCDEDVTDYETADNAGSTYTWEVTGGNIIDGQGTYMATIEWGVAGNGTVTVTEMDEIGCSTTTEAFEVFIDDCTDISENGLNSFKVYPNPATSLLNVEFTNGSQINTMIFVYNHLGQVVLESVLNAKEAEQNVQFDVSGLTNGLYIIKVQFGNESVITKQIMKN